MAGKNEDLKFSIALDDAAFRQQLTNEKGQLTRFGREAKRLFGQIGDDRALQLGKELKLLNDVEIKQKKYLSTLRQTIQAGGRGGAAGGFGGKAQMGVSSVAYAVEDFFASSGSLSNRLRGVSNNVSQLGMALGGVQGLIAGVAIGALGQLAAKMFEANEVMADSATVADAMTKAENELAKSREEAAAQVKKIGDELRNVGLSDEERKKLSHADEAEALAKSATKALRDAVALYDPRVREASGKAEVLRKQAAGSTVMGFRAMNERKAAEQDAIAEARIDEVIAGGPRETAILLVEEFHDLMTEMTREYQDRVRHATETGAWATMPNPGLREGERAALKAREIIERGGDVNKMFDDVVATIRDGAAKALGPTPNPAADSNNAKLLAISEAAAGRRELLDSFKEYYRQSDVAKLAPPLRRLMDGIEAFRKATAGAEGFDRQEADGQALQARMLAQKVFEGVKAGAMDAEFGVRSLEAKLAQIGEGIPAWEKHLEAEKALADARKKAAEEAKKAADAEQTRLDGLAEVFKAKSPLFEEDRDRQKVRDLLEGAREAGVANPLEGVIQVLQAEFAGAADGVSKFSVAAKKGTMVLQDTSTGAGAAEYARLLSGDDSARSAELTEARGTNKRLDDLIALARDEAAI